jgi:uncharacterized protein YidB (DUF937 family)
MGLLDSVIGVLSGSRTSGGRGDMLSAVLGMLADDGDGPGIAELLQRFERCGHGQQIGSWIGSGENLPISADALCQALGTETIDRLAAQMGLSQGVTADRLSQLLPFVIDKLTPGGVVPEEGLGDMGRLMGRMGSL